jgi:bifunctional non-homologous end joining protein LigD
MRYKPMLLKEVKQLPTGEDWGYEAKLDGYRIVGEASDESTTLFTRNDNDFTHRYPAVVNQLSNALANQSAVVDGEMVGYTEEGQYSFSEMRKKHPRVVYFIFDLLELDLEPIIDKPLSERRAMLEDLLIPQPNILLSKMFNDGPNLVEAAKQQGLEGVVAKRLASNYQPGIRSSNWLKLILQRHTDGWRRP